MTRTLWTGKVLYTVSLHADHMASCELPLIRLSYSGMAAYSDEAIGLKGGEKSSWSPRTPLQMFRISLPLTLHLPLPQLGSDTASRMPPECRCCEGGHR